MSIRKITATRVFGGDQWLPPGTVLVLSDQGLVLDRVQMEDAGDDVERLDGVLTPGFVNAHCHLELSHLRGQIAPRSGMAAFLMGVIEQRTAPPQQIEAAMEEAVAEMRRNGIVAVGDVSNRPDSINVKAKSDLYFHHFVEVTGLVPQTARQRWEAGVELAKAFLERFPAEQVTITPHATYSVSFELLQIIADQYPDRVLSLHLMESEDENLFFRERQGNLLRLFAKLGVALDFFQPTGLNAIRSWWPNMRRHRPWLWVHNTETSLHDLEWLDAEGADWSQLYWCLCPASNQYINLSMPAIHRFRQRFPLQICLGTDSLASNHTLDMVYEMRLMQRLGKLNDLGVLLQMATLNGAHALGIADRFGRFEKGMRPGVVLLGSVEGDALTARSQARRIL